MPTKGNPFYRLVSPGVVPRDGVNGSGVVWASNLRLFVEIDYREGRLSITGVEGPLSNGDCRGSCGQTGIAADLVPNAEEGWDTGKVDKLRRIWERWHLNDMRAGCAHQRKDWATDEPLELQELTWGPIFHEQRRLAESGKLSAAQYEDYSAAARQVYRLTIGIARPNGGSPGPTGTPKHPRIWGAEGDALLSSGYLKLGKKETRTANWVYPSEHPDGLLTKPCPKCGYKYGSAWLREEVPASVLGFLCRLKDTKMNYAWAKRRSA